MQVSYVINQYKFYSENRVYGLLLRHLRATMHLQVQSCVLASLCRNLREKNESKSVSLSDLGSVEFCCLVNLDFRDIPLKI